MKVYIAGPITGKPDGNKAAFLAAHARLSQLGHDPINPHDIMPVTHDGPCPDGPLGGQDVDPHNAPCYMRTDLQALLTCDAIYLLNGWELSSGARTEFEVGRAAGLRIMYELADSAEVMS